ncbi:MAG: hypothetical protein ACHQ9S_10865 [Candidatus Binatia bacterium]
MRAGRRIGIVVSVAVAAALGACTTTERAARLVIDHHLGMAQGAIDIMSGEAEAREQRVAKLQADLEASRLAVATEQDQDRLVELLKQHVVLQDALVAELKQGHGQHGGGHQHAAAQADGGADAHQH